MSAVCTDSVRRMAKRFAKMTQWRLAILVGVALAGLLLCVEDQLRALMPTHERNEAPNVAPLAVAPTVARRTVAGGRSYLSVTSKTDTDSSANESGSLLLVIHGDTGSAESVRTYTGFDQEVLAKTPNARIAYLQAENRYWHLSHIQTELDYIQSVVADNATTARVFIFGWSSGAHLAQTFACQNPSVTAIALSGGRGAHTCIRKLPTLVLHNTGDKAHIIELGDALVSALRQHNHCSEATKDALMPPCLAYQDCAAELTYCRTEGGSHRPWANTARVSWSFFEAVRVPR
jgi:pimeloyl-ACP methyl ester carboxylesterase